MKKSVLKRKSNRKIKILGIEKSVPFFGNIANTMSMINWLKFVV